MKNLTLFFFALTMLTFSCRKDNPSAIVKTIHVPNEVSSIQEAINKARDFDTILVSNGTYEENINFSGKHIYLTSMYYKTLDTVDIKNTIIKGKSGSVVTFENNEDSTSIINGFFITNGTPIVSKPHLEGGGIYIKHSHPTLNNLILENNITFYPNEQGIGGGIYCDSGSIKGYNLTIRKNRSGGAGGGGGIYASNSKVTLKNTFVYNNHTSLIEFCGGIYFNKVNFEIQDSRIENNFFSSRSNANQFIGCNGRLENTIVNDSIKFVNSNVVYSNCTINGKIYP